MKTIDVKKKWNQIYSSGDLLNSPPANVLTQFSFLLPKKGYALDIASGLGTNSIFLAQHGLHVEAWDISEQAQQKLQQKLETNAEFSQLSLNSIVRDVQANPPAQCSFDVICVCYFLERSISRHIIQALKPNGLLFYETFIHEKVTDSGPSTPEFRLGENELLSLFSELHILQYQEYGTVGDVKQGTRNIASLVAQKR